MGSPYAMSMFLFGVLSSESVREGGMAESGSAETHWGPWGLSPPGAVLLHHLAKTEHCQTWVFANLSSEKCHLRVILIYIPLT